MQRASSRFWLNRTPRLNSIDDDDDDDADDDNDDDDDDDDDGYADYDVNHEKYIDHDGHNSSTG